MTEFRRCFSVNCCTACPFFESQDLKCVALSVDGDLNTRWYPSGLGMDSFWKCQHLCSYGSQLWYQFRSHPSNSSPSPFQPTTSTSSSNNFTTTDFPFKFGNSFICQLETKHFVGFLCHGRCGSLKLLGVPPILNFISATFSQLCHKLA